jgi:hypothetical protein
MGRRLAFILGLCAIAWASLAMAEEPHASAKASRLSGWTGLSAGPDYFYAYVGSAIFLSGSKETGGFLTRFGLGGGGYRTSGDEPHNVAQYDVDLLVGFRANPGDGMIAFFAGGDFNNHDNRDPDASPSGTEWGVKGIIEAYAPLGRSIYFAAYGNYSTAFDTFASDAKVAYRLTETLALGPEIAAVGSAGFTQARGGLAAAWKVIAETELSGAAGVARDLDDGDLGFYGTINLYTDF